MSPTTALPMPEGFTLKAGDGVTAAEREEIQTGLALALRYLGVHIPMTVLADTDLEKLLQAYSKDANVTMTSQTITTMRQDFQSGAAQAVGGSGRITIFVNDSWRRKTKVDRWRTIVHEYLHSTQSARGTSWEPFWLVEGNAWFWDRRFLVELGVADYQLVRQEMIDLTLGLNGKLETMEAVGSARTEDIRGPYALGFLATEFLVMNYGETKVYPEFWDKRTRAPWQATFEQVFGFPPKDFYQKFEEYRQKEFPPVCTPADGASGDLGIRFVRRQQPGTLPMENSDATLTTTPYLFCFRGVQFGLMSGKEQTDFIKPPTGWRTWASCGGNCLTLYMYPDQSFGDKTLAVQLPDGRRAEAAFVHR